MKKSKILDIFFTLIEEKMEVICFRCKRSPEKISEYITGAKAEKISPEEYVIENEGTFNPISKHFCCTECYIDVGMPSSSKGWKAP